MTTLLASIVLVAIALILIAVRVIFVKGGLFRGTCGSNNPFLKKEGVKCPTCGSKPDEDCKKDK